VARSPHNVVAIDLPEDANDPYAAAAALLARWRSEGAVVRDEQPALWALEQSYAAPDGTRHVRRGFLSRVRVEEYGPGRIRPHERTHPGPKEDRLRLTRATRANLSPIFALYSDPAGAAAAALEPQLQAAPWGEATDEQDTAHRLWRVDDADAIAAVQEALGDAELLIADGHHRYETARTYADEVGGEGPHRYVLMCLVALEDPGLTVLPTHRLVRGLDSSRQEELAAAIRRDFEIEEIADDALVPAPGGPPLQLGYMDAHFRRPFRLVLRDQAIADAALADMPEPYRRLDAAVLEELLLKRALGMEDEDIESLNGFGYARDADEARALLERREYDAAFFMRPTAIEQVRAVAASGASMPPKSTYFSPKIPTGLVFNQLDDG
jgi:uncharacterized protein (DUF1015 family)